MRTVVIVNFVSLLLLVYSYGGYFMLLAGLWLFLRHERVRKGHIRPRITLIISCYNEENVIRGKLENSLALNYPKEKLEILVVSDASSDQTDRIVSEYAGLGIRLIRLEERLGKTVGLNRAVAEASGEFIVFSDANSMYEAEALAHLVENFGDKKVGYVVGEAR